MKRRNFSDFFTLLHLKYLFQNILFGKSIQNSRDHINVKFVRTAKEMSELARKGNYLNRMKICKNFVAVSSRPESVKFDRAFAIGKNVYKSNLIRTKS